MFQAVQRLRELSDGYALQFPNEPGMFMTLASFLNGSAAPSITLLWK